MRTAILSSLRVATGNAVTARRLSSVLTKAGCIIDCMLDVSKITVAELTQILAKVDLLVAVHAFRAGSLYLQAAPPELPILLIVGGTDVNCMASDERRAIVVKAMARAYSIVAFNEALAERAKTLVGDALSGNIAYVPQSVSSQTEKSNFCIRKACGLQVDTVVLLLVCGLRAVKAPLFLAEQMAKWHENENLVHLVIIGPPLDRAMHDAVVAASAAPGSGLKYHTAVPHADLLQAISEADVLVNSSVSEGQSNAILEAMAIGTPVAARRNEGNVSLVSHQKSGIIFDSPAEFQEGVQKLLNVLDFRESIIKEARQKAQNFHSVAEEEQAYYRLVEQARVSIAHLPSSISPENACTFE